jgi:creatinine amidohydrolase
METIYLKKFIEYSKKGIAYIPIGTIEWHGNHMPIETDFLVAQKVCEILSKKVKGYILPPIYLATDKSTKIKGKEFRGMDRHLKKKLPGSIYYLKPQLLYKVLESLCDNLVEQGFNKIIIVTGHGASKQVEILNKLEKSNKKIVFLNPYKNLITSAGGHADVAELSFFWALFPNELQKSLKRKIPKGDDYFMYKGYDPRQKASLSLGKKLLKQAISSLLKEIK